MFYSILYFAKENVKFSTDDFVKLLDSARERNQKLNVTGKLMYCEGAFFHLLEGAKSDVEVIFKRIEGDKRLASIKIVSTFTSDERQFPDMPIDFDFISAEEVRKNIDLESADITDFLADASENMLLKLLRNNVD